MDKRGQLPAARAVAMMLRPLDKRRAAEAAVVAANSHYVAARVRKFWDIDPTVIYPPVDTAKFAVGQSSVNGREERILSSLPDTYVLGASRFIPYKRLDLVIKAGERAGLPVVLAGDGPERARLQLLADNASVPVVILGRPSTELLSELYRRAAVYIFPAVEDFGIMPVEAMASGTPVIANQTGGAAESVVPGTTGFLVESFDSSETTALIHKAERLNKRLIREHAATFDSAVFRHEIKHWVNTSIEDQR